MPIIFRHAINLPPCQKITHPVMQVRSRDVFELCRKAPGSCDWPFYIMCPINASNETVTKNLKNLDRNLNSLL